MNLIPFKLNIDIKFKRRPRIYETVEYITLKDGSVVKKTTFHGYNV